MFSVDKMSTTTKSSDFYRKDSAILRNNLYIKHSSRFIKNFNKDKAFANISNSTLLNILERNPFNHCLEALSFSIYITQIAFDEIFQDNNYSLEEKITIAGNIAEIGFREFADPYDTKIIYKNLAAAKKIGYFFTPLPLARKMVDLGLKSFNTPASVLDPACGIGTLLAAFLIKVPETKTVVGFEIDELTAKLGKVLLNKVCKELKISPHINIYNQDFLDHISVLHKTKKESEKFDFVIMNPPYGRVRFLSSYLTNKETQSNLGKSETKSLAQKLRSEHKNEASILRERFEHIGLGQGTPEYSKIFLGAALNQLSENGRVVAITPSSWLADQDGKELRKYIFSNYGISEIWNFNETGNLFQTVNQPTSVSCISKRKTKEIIIRSNLRTIKDIDTHSEPIEFEKVVHFSKSYLRIPRFGNSRAALLEKIHQHKILKDYQDIKNLRGELDLTAHKDLLSTDGNLTRLVRGIHISKYFLHNPEEFDRTGYVDSARFISRMGNSSKINHTQGWRIALPQCSYMQKRERIEACLVPPNTIISNSCNYLFISGDQSLEDMYFYCAVINSTVLEWRFRMFNSNNHVANFEIDEFPLIIPSQADNRLRKEIVFSVKQMMDNNDFSDREKIDNLIAKTYGLNNKETSLIFSDLNLDI